MDVIPKESLSGYIAQKAELKRGVANTSVLVFKLGQKRYRREPAGSFTLISTGYVSLVMFGALAEAANERFMVGDDVVALGTFTPRGFERDGQQREVVEFRTNKLLFDTSRSRYEVTRISQSKLATASASDAAPSRETVAHITAAPLEDPAVDAPATAALALGR